MDFTPLTSKALESWRKRYRDQLGVPMVPEFHEALCRYGQAYELRSHTHVIGYVIHARETWKADWGSVIPEIFLPLDQARVAKQMLIETIEKFGAKSLLSRTDDPIFPMLMDLHVTNQLVSPFYLFERAPLWHSDDRYTLSESTLDDAERLASLYAAVPPEEGGIPDLTSLMKSLSVWRHYRLTVTGGDLAAVCYIAPQGGRYFSAWPIVSSQYRGQGIGKYILTYALAREMAENRTGVLAIGSENEQGKALVESVGAKLVSYFVHFALNDLNGVV